MVERTAPDRRDETVAAQVDPAKFLFGFRYSDGAFTPRARASGTRIRTRRALRPVPGCRCCRRVRTRRATS